MFIKNTENSHTHTSDFINSFAATSCYNTLTKHLI